MSNSTIPWDLTRAIQVRLALEPSGVWDVATQRAYDAARPENRRRIDELLRREGYSDLSLSRVTTKVTRPVESPSPIVARPSSGQTALYGKRVVPQASRAEPSSQSRASMSKEVQRVSAKRYLTQSEIEELISNNPRARELPTGYMLMSADLEAAGQSDGRKRLNYDSLSQHGSYRGLYQMGESAWKSAREMDPSIGSYSNAFDPQFNTNAAIALGLYNMRALRRLGYKGPMTKEILYAAHNQGPSGAMRMAKSNTVDMRQSKKAIPILVTAKEQLMQSA